jgi:hypothetical protein
MVRWVFFSLLLANLISLYWFVWVQGNQTPRPAQQSLVSFDGAERLIMLEEVGAEALVFENFVKTVKSGEDQASVENPTAPGTDRQKIAGSSSAQENNTERVLHEDGAEEVITVTSSLDCTLVGFFENRSGAAVVQKRLGEVGVKVGIVAREKLEREVFWLVIPDPGSVGEASRLLDRLKQQSVESFLIEEGEFAGSISLGVFGNRENVEAYRTTLREKGYAPRINPLPRFELRYALVFERLALERLSDSFWEDISVRVVSEELVVEPAGCTVEESANLN